MVVDGNGYLKPVAADLGAALVARERGDMPRALVTDICISEMGWELMEWQGHVRKLAENFKYVVVSSARAFQPFYADFADRFIPHDIKGERDCHRMRPGSITNMEEVKRARAEIEAVRAELVRTGYDVTRVQSIPKKKGKAVGERRPIEHQKFIRFGDAANAALDLDVIIHARNRISDFKSGGDNYPLEQWLELLDLVRKMGFENVGAIGTKEAALAPDGTVDLRDTDLQIVMDQLAAAKFALGPSSGPMHLASLCGTPHAVWATDRHQEVIQHRNKDRYLTYWNPLKTKAAVVLHKKRKILSPERIAQTIEELLKL